MSKPLDMNVAEPGRLYVAAVAGRPAPIPLALPAVEPGRLALTNRLSRRRQPLVARLEGAPLALTFVPGGGEQVSEVLAAGLEIGERAARLELPTAFVHRLIARLEPALSLHTLDAERALLLVDLALTPFIESIERALGRRISPMEEASAARSGGDRQAIEAALVFEGEPCGRARLSLPIEEAMAIAGLLDGLPPEKADLSMLPVPLVFRFGAATLTAGEILSLREGDVVICDRIGPEADDVVAVLGERWCFAAKIAGHAITLAAARRPIPGTLRELWTMPDTDPVVASALAAEEAALDELPIKLLFEIGRQEVALGTLQSLGPGHVFDLGRAPDRPIRIFANGQCIGEGEVVRIGDAVGVRATRLFGHG